MEEWPQDCLKEAAPDGGRTLQGSDSAPFAEDATSILGSSGEPAEAPNVYLESMAFNQDGSCFIAGTSEGFRVYTSSPLTEFVRREGSNWPDRGVHTAAMLFRTNVFATVSKLENRKVKFWDDSRRRFIGELRSRQPVKSVCLTRDVLAMVTDFAGVLGGYFGASRSFAQFHLPQDLKLLDSRSPTSTISGPLVAFAGPVSNHLFLLCPSGVFCELRFDLSKGQECTLLTASTWFAPRPNFQIQPHLGTAALPSELEGGHDGDQWQLVL
ncbi:WD repeat domain phosphoinositide-interacting protein 3 [Cyclospora cayetanensis]|uniref:WD repeat domain phosphoinositide-interacting protein 3 n=1 Tax=Cyclospora cayetanensis TaxID=88456 RepID=A0A6P6RP88_9EIME|nr:WD repeat domain phosphoinositide-interacting protein 3 [Cyclospora cayetanensis]